MTPERRLLCQIMSTGNFLLPQNTFAKRVMAPQIITTNRKGRTSQMKPYTTQHSSPIANSFTMTELLIVIAIIAVLAAMLLPVLSKARAAAHTTTCLGTQKQLGQSTLMYIGDFAQLMNGCNHWSCRNSLSCVGTGKLIHNGAGALTVAGYLPSMASTSQLATNEITLNSHGDWRPQMLKCAIGPFSEPDPEDKMQWSKGGTIVDYANPRNPFVDTGSSHFGGKQFPNLGKMSREVIFVCRAGGRLLDIVGHACIGYHQNGTTIVRIDGSAQRISRNVYGGKNLFNDALEEMDGNE